MTAIPDDVQPGCPRCSYDLRAACATWTDRCPLTGTCTECGLEFSWPDVLRPDRQHGPLWTVEGAVRRRSAPLAAVRTWMASVFAPWWFWSRVSMVQHVRWKRIAAYLLLVFMFSGGCVIPVQLCASIFMRVQIAMELASEHARLERRADQLAQAFAALGPEAGDALQQRYADEIQRLSGMERGSVNGPIVLTVLESVVLPMRSTSAYTITYGDGASSPYPAPLEITTGVWQAVPNLQATVVRYVVSQAMAAAIVTVLVPGSFVLLPISRRRAKVRWWHVARVALYSLTIPMSGAALLLLVALLIGEYAIGAGFLAMVGWLALWWWSAISRYLRMPHGAAVAILLTVLCTLLAWAGAFMIVELID